MDPITEELSELGDDLGEPGGGELGGVGLDEEAVRDILERALADDEHGGADGKEEEGTDAEQQEDAHRGGALVRGTAEGAEADHSGDRCEQDCLAHELKAVVYALGSDARLPAIAVQGMDSVVNTNPEYDRSGDQVHVVVFHSEDVHQAQHEQCSHCEREDCQ